MEEGEPRHDVVVVRPQNQLADLASEDLGLEARGRDDVPGAHEVPRPVAVGVGAHVNLRKGVSPRALLWTRSG